MGWTGAVKCVLILFHCLSRPRCFDDPVSPIAVLDGVPIFAAAGARRGLGGCSRCSLTLIALWRAAGARRREREAAEARQEAIEARFAALAKTGAELNGRVAGMAEWLGSRQTISPASSPTGSIGRGAARRGTRSQAQTTGETLGRLNERLAVIDAAQARLTEMTREVVSLKDILANKQARGAFGQGRMEAIVRDGLPAGAYDFQFTLSNRARPDCVIRLPGDARLLAVDAKFPLEAFSSLRAARDEEARKGAGPRARRCRQACQGHRRALSAARRDSGHRADVRPLRGGLFRSRRAFRRCRAEGPSRPRGHRLADADDDGDQVTQAILRDARMRDEAHEIQAEVGKLLKDVRLIVERAAKLESHFRQAQDDLAASARQACGSRGAASGSRRWTSPRPRGARAGPVEPGEAGGVGEGERPLACCQSEAEELEISQGTAYRDVAGLIGQRVPIEGEAGRGYLLAADYDMPPLMLSSDEIEAVMLELSGWRAIPTRFFPTRPATWSRRSPPLSPNVCAPSSSSRAWARNQKSGGGTRQH